MDVGSHIFCEITHYAGGGAGQENEEEEESCQGQIGFTQAADPLSDTGDGGKDGAGCGGQNDDSQGELGQLS